MQLHRSGRRRNQQCSILADVAGPPPSARFPRDLPAQRHARRPVLVPPPGLRSGRRSLQQTPRWQRLLEAIVGAGIDWQQINVEDEPSPELVDEAVGRHRDDRIDVADGEPALGQDIQGRPHPIRHNRARIQLVQCAP